MSDQDKSKELFQGSTSTTTDKSVEGTLDATKSGDTTQGALATLVGEGRKYKTVEDLAKGYLNADEHIEVLKNDNAALKTDVAKGKTINEVLERIEQGRKQTGDTTSVAQKAISAEDIERLVDARLTGRETARTRDANISKAEAALVAKFGEKAKTVYAQKADSPEKRKALNNLAAVDPESFTALFSTTTIVGNPADSSTKAGDTLNVVSQSGRAADADCKEFYDVMRKKEPNKYYSQAIQLEMHKKLATDPSKFLGRKVA